MSDLLHLAKATLRLYLRALRDAARASFSYWQLLIPQLGLLLIAPFLQTVVFSLFGPLAGGFLLGLLLSLFVSYYLVTVRAAVEDDGLTVKESVRRALELFGPVLSILFVLYLLTLLADHALARPEQLWIKLSLSLIIAVVFNPLPEILYIRPAHTFEMFGQSAEFMKENFIEWFLPYAIAAVPVFIVHPHAASGIGLSLIVLNPIYLIQFAFSFLGTLPLFLLPFIVLCGYFIMIFRGKLFLALSRSTRRKRIYQSRFGG